MKQDESWYAHVGELKAYVEENGKYPPSNSLLGYWVSHQRYAYHHGILLEERAAYLEANGFRWTVDEETRKQSLREAEKKYYTRTWYKHFNELKEYLKEHGCFPTTGKTGCWLYQQRHKWKQGKLPEAYRLELEKIGVKFWGGGNVDGQEIRNKRLAYCMTQEQLACLLGMTGMNVSKMERMDVPEERVRVIFQKMEEGQKILQQNQSEEKWQKAMSEFCAYLKKHNGTYPPEGTKLAKWVLEQRFLKSCKRLNQNQIRQLNALDFNWNPEVKKETTRPRNPKDAWNTSYMEAKDFSEENGRLPTSKDGRIGIWVYQQKYRYLHGRLPEDRKKKLEEIGVVFEPEDK